MNPQHFLRLFALHRDLQARLRSAENEVDSLREQVAEANRQEAIWQDRVDQADRETSWLRGLVEESRKSENYARESMANFIAQSTNGTIPYPGAAQLPQRVFTPEEPGSGGTEFISPARARAKQKQKFLEKSAEKLRMS